MIKIKHLIALVIIPTVLLLLRLLKPVVRIIPLLLSEARIGEFAAGTDFYLRQVKNNAGRSVLGVRLTAPPQKEVIPSGIWAPMVDKPCNEQLLKMFCRYMNIKKRPFLLRLFNHNMTPDSAFTNTLKSAAYRLIIPTISDYQFLESEPVLQFTDEEEQIGQKLLQSMGIPENGWFVCYHARDSAYLESKYPNIDKTTTDVRNCSITNYIDSMDYISSLGGYAVRIGSVVNTRLDITHNPKIIDYASDFQSDFGDIYLLAKCKFFVGCNSGITAVPVMFNVPVIESNCLVMPIIPPNNFVEYRALSNRDLFLPKPIFSKHKDRPLRLNEIFSSQVQYFDNGDKYSEFNLMSLENSSADILEITKEMYQRLDGVYIPDSQDDCLQSKFRSLGNVDPEFWEHLPHIGAKFLRDHSDELTEF